MNKTISLIRETIIKLLEEDTKFFEGDSVLTSEGDKGVVTLSKHPFYAVKLNDTGTTHSYHFTNLLVDPEAESGLDLGKYDVDPQPEEEQPEIKEIKVNKPISYRTLSFKEVRPYERGKLQKDSLLNFIKQNPGLTSNNIIDLFRPDISTNLETFGAIHPMQFNRLLSKLLQDGNIYRKKITNPQTGKKIYIYYTEKKPEELKESSPSEIIYLDGLLSVQEDLNVTDVLSDIRSIPGITVVRPVDIPGESHKNKLKIKIDPYPFNGSDETSIKNKIKQLIRKVPGVKEFFTNIAQINELKFTIKDPK